MKKWKKISGYQAEISDHGDIRTIAKTVGVIEIPSRPLPTYLVENNTKKIVSITGDDGSKTTRFIHTLVAEAFVKKENPNYNVVVPIDGDFCNTKAENLQWVSRSDAISLKKARK